MTMKQYKTAISKMDKQNFEEIAAFVRSERARLRWTQPELASKAGVSHRSITTLEKGNKITISTINKVLEALGFTMKTKTVLTFERKE